MSLLRFRKSFFSLVRPTCNKKPLFAPILLKNLSSIPQQPPINQQQQQQSTNISPATHNFGDLPLLQSEERSNRKWTQIEEIDESLAGQEVLIRGRLSSIRSFSKLAFLVLRENYSTVQAVLAKTKDGQVSAEMLEWTKKISPESIVDIYGVVSKTKDEVKACTQNKVELQISKVYVVSRSNPVLPFQLEDASRPFEQGEVEMEDANPSESAAGSRVLLKTRLDHRVIDLRTRTNQAIMTVQSGVCQLFREYLYQKKFVEIHTPKLLGGQSEGGANVFKLKYFDRDACLSQSPQLHKQMSVMADFQRVFEIGPVFRAEKSFGPRHLCEFTGLDLEMTIKESYHEVLDVMCELFEYIFEGIEKRYAKEVAIIKTQYPSEAFKFKNPVVRLTFEEGCQLLKEEGIHQDPSEDLETETEKKLGEIVRKKYDTDFFILHKYPIKARPFYTMPCQENPQYTNSYDLFMRGQEIISGAQRVHEPELLIKRAEECGIQVDTVKDYIDAFRYGAYPHGGCGIGLERVVMLYFGLGNIRKSTLFPRDPSRIAP